MVVVAIPSPEVSASAEQVAAVSTLVVGPPLGPVVDVSADHKLTVTWGGVPGADGVDVAGCPLVIAPRMSEQTRANRSTSADGNAVVVSLPAGEYLRSLTLHDLARVDGDDETPIKAFGDLGDRRLTLALAPSPSSPFPPPAFVIPNVAGSDQIPDSLTGAWLEFTPQPVVRLPAGVRGDRVRVALSTGDDFQAQPMRLGQVAAGTARVAADLKVTGPDGAEAFALPGEVPPALPRQNVDLASAARIALEGQLPSDGSPLSATFVVRGGTGSSVRLGFAGATGALLRTLRGTSTTHLAGEPVAPAGLAELPTIVPGAVVGDLTIEYAGMRVEPQLSDTPPAAGIAVSGVVVAADRLPVHQPFPPAGVGSHPVARIGLYGRAEVDCQLSVGVVRFDNGVPGERLGPVTPVDVTASTRFGFAWAHLPGDLATAMASGGAMAIAVSASQGRFLWATTTGGTRIARVVVTDPKPPPTPVRLGDAILATVDSAGMQQRGTTLPAPMFTGNAPALTSDLFVRVDLTDVVLRYPR